MFIIAPIYNRVNTYPLIGRAWKLLCLWLGRLLHLVYKFFSRDGNN